MKTIWKFKIEITDGIIRVNLPKGSEILSFQCQHDVPTIWALCDPEEENEEREFCIYGTGHNISDIENKRFIGTAQQFGGGLIWHLFEVPDF